MNKDLMVFAQHVRYLAVDMVEKAKSGHPGMPLGMADVASVLFNNHLNFNSNDPEFYARDRFVLSCGHGSALLYACLYLCGYDISLQDLKSFRQLHAKTPGHPEYGMTPGVELTTGPLGQGLAMSVGLAMAERHLAAQFNKPNVDLVDNFTYVFASDGCLMEGISHEACSLAGTWQLGKLIVFWDDNGISIDGEVEGWFTDNTLERFSAYHWQVIAVDGHDLNAIDKAITDAKHHPRPTLIACKTIIGKGSSKQGTGRSAWQSFRECCCCFKAK